MTLSQSCSTIANSDVSQLALKTAQHDSEYTHMHPHRQTSTPKHRVYSYSTITINKNNQDLILSTAAKLHTSSLLLNTMSEASSSQCWTMLANSWEVLYFICVFGFICQFLCFRQFLQADKLIILTKQPNSLCCQSYQIYCLECIVIFLNNGCMM